MRSDKRITLKIGYKDYDMFFVKKIDGGATLGDCENNDGTRGVIRIAKGQRKVEKANVILHEILHAIVYTQGLKINDKEEEKIVLALTNGLIDFMKENPKVIKSLASLLRKS